MVAGRRDQRGELGEELGRCEEQLGAPVGDRPLEAVADLPVGKHGEAFERKGWPGAVAAELLEAFAVVGVEMDAGVERETFDERVRTRRGVESVEIAFALVTDCEDRDHSSPGDLEQHDVASASERNDQFAKEWAGPATSGLPTGEGEFLEHGQCLLDRVHCLCCQFEVLLQQKAVEAFKVLPCFLSESDAVAHRVFRAFLAGLPDPALRALSSRRRSPATTRSADVYLPERRALSPEARPRLTNSSSIARFRTRSSTASTMKEESVSPVRSSRSAWLRSRGSTRRGGKVEVFMSLNVSQMRCRRQRQLDLWCPAGRHRGSQPLRQSAVLAAISAVRAARRSGRHCIQASSGNIRRRKSLELLPIAVGQNCAVRFEIRSTRKGIGGSNPSLSANHAGNLPGG